MRKRRLLREFSKDFAGLNNIIHNLDYILYYDGYANDDDKLNSIVLFCKEHFNDVQCGSSRIVCEYDESVVIKIAIPNGKGVYQNQLEYKTCQQMADTTLFPRVYFHSDDYQWIVAERVVVAEEYDFEAIVGLPFDAYSDEVDSDYEQYKRPKMHEYFTMKEFIDTIRLFQIENSRNTPIGNDRNKKIASILVTKSDFLNALADFISTTDTLVGDLKRPENWGIVNRNGKTTMVILDSGIDLNGYNTLYKR